MIRAMCVLLILFTATVPPCSAETVEQCQQLLATGKYEDGLKVATVAIENRSYGEEWPILKTRAELALGKYPETLKTISEGLERYSWSVRLRQLQHECALANGERALAADALTEVEKLVSSASWRYTDADDLVALGQVALALRADAKDVQEGFFERARKNYATRPDGFLAAGRLAIDKGDVAFAAELLTPAAKNFPDNADILFLLSEALRSADREQAAELLQKTLEINPTFAPTLLRVTEQQIDSEDYSDAEETIQQLLATNADLPEAHALQSVIHHLRNDLEKAAESRTAALKFSAANPQVDFLIGRKLSQKYRFMEGSEFQRKALLSDPEFNPAMIQLAQDLLRLGRETEGWQMAEQAHAKDGYDTNLFNLLQLKDSLDQFTTVSSEHFQIRMEKHEAAVYGPRVVALLERAWADLIPRYEFSPELPVIVEIYPRAEDFAVRTFGVPDVAGFLGVCFGKVVTANSPANRRDHPLNWESILWHEFCHVVTLQKTGNKIPRWLSEGISVYEERRTDPRWGQNMSIEHRDRVLSGKITPVAELSSAFLTAKGGEDLNFAYFESSMVVEHIVAVHGLPALNAVLQDLNTGVQINDALDRHAGGLESLEESFRKSLTEQAAAFAAGVEFDSEALKEAKLSSVESVGIFIEEHPKNFPAMLLQASLLVKESKLVEAEAALKKLVELVPDDNSTNGPRRLLANVYKQIGNAEKEATTLTEHLQRTADDLEATVRLQELRELAKQPEQVEELGRAVVAIDPFQTVAVTRALNAAETLGHSEAAIGHLSSLLQLQPDDAPRLHFRIAKLQKTSAPAESLRHVLLSLEQAPRFRDAHRLLLELTEVEGSATPDAAN